MTTDSIALTAPTFSPANGVLFSAYRFGIGYRAFLLSYEAACERLGAHTQDREQVMLAFRLNREKILTAIAAKLPCEDDTRIVLVSRDFD
jgi:hypothetical protein